MKTNYPERIDELKKEIEEIKIQIDEKWNNMPNFGVDNFFIQPDCYAIRFIHKDLRDVSFSLEKSYSLDENFPFLNVSSLSWSSWSYYNIEEKEWKDLANKSIEYLQANIEKVEVCRDHSYLSIAKEYWNWVKENILPLKEKGKEKLNLIKDLQKQIEEEKLASEKEEAIEYFKNNQNTHVYVHARYYYNNTSYTQHFEIKEFKKDKVKVDFNGINKWYNEEKMLELYKHINKSVYYCDIDYHKSLDDPKRHTFYKYDNHTDENFTKYNTIEIAEQEYRSNRW